MPDRIDVPPTLSGSEAEQLKQLWSYLYQVSEKLNADLDGIGTTGLTDRERQVMRAVINSGNVSDDAGEMESLKSLVIKTASFVQTRLNEFRTKLLGETVASGQFGRYVRNTELDVEVTPEGITQNYTFQETVQDLKRYEVNAKNYIKTGLLRTVSSVPVYGVAIGRDVVTFSQDGTETYNDGNKVAELTADELSFWQGGAKVAGYTGNRISFYYNGAEAFYILNGKIYCNDDLELGSGKSVKIQGWTFDGEGVAYDDGQGGSFEIKELVDEDNGSTAGVYYELDYHAVGTPWYSGAVYLKAMRNSGLSESAKLRMGFDQDPDTNQYFLSLRTDHYWEIGNQSYPVKKIYAEEIIGNHGGASGDHPLKLVTKSNPQNHAMENYIEIYEDSNGQLFLELHSRATGFLSRGSNIGTSANPVDNIKCKDLDCKTFSAKEMNEKVGIATTDLDDLTDDGIWWIDFANVTAHGPSDLTSGVFAVEMSRSPSFFATYKGKMQKIYTGAAIYTRVHDGTAWGGWYKYAGTAV